MKKNRRTIAAQSAGESIAVHPSNYEEYTPAAARRPRSGYRTAQRLSGVRAAQHVTPFQEEDGGGEPGEMQYEPLSTNGPLAESASCGSECGDCSECGGEYCNDCDRPLFGLLGNWGHRNLAIFGGVHGYKGPRDRGMNGNFGFQEGVNYGAPLGRSLGMRLPTRFPSPAKQYFRQPSQRFADGRPASIFRHGGHLPPRGSRQNSMGRRLRLPLRYLHQQFQLEANPLRKPAG